MAGWKVHWDSRENGCPEMSHGSVPDDTSNIGMSPSSRTVQAPVPRGICSMNPLFFLACILHSPGYLLRRHESTGETRRHLCRTQEKNYPDLRSEFACN